MEIGKTSQSTQTQVVTCRGCTGGRCPGDCIWTPDNKRAIVATSMIDPKLFKNPT